MHLEILSKEQTNLLPFIKNFSSDFYLVGRTAIALQVGHRRSIDFDLFTTKSFLADDIRKKIKTTYKIQTILFEKPGEITLAIDNVKITFLTFPYKVSSNIQFDNFISMPDLLTLSAMKAFALGRRAKWKDYVDLFFILKTYHLEDISDKARSIFKNEFNERLFREQLAYYTDIDYSEEIDFLPKFKISDLEIKTGLTKESVR